MDQVYLFLAAALFFVGVYRFTEVSGPDFDPVPNK